MRLKPKCLSQSFLEIYKKISRPSSLRIVSFTSINHLLLLLQLIIYPSPYVCRSK
uniref:Uncharacterized protein n=1 Tax=Helianthus annuus TaxID=4232 RepID=A0A251V4Y0_HELAN